MVISNISVLGYSVVEVTVKKKQVHRLHAEQRWSWTEMATSVFLTCSSLHSCDTMHLFEELLREPERKHCFFKMK